MRSDDTYLLKFTTEKLEDDSQELNTLGEGPKLALGYLLLNFDPC